MPRMTEADVLAYQQRHPALAAQVNLTPPRHTGGGQTGQEKAQGQAPAKNKYGAIRTEYNGVLYDSKGEAECAQRLDLMVKAGEVLEWTPQPEFELYGGIRYRGDFHVIYAVGRPRVIDFKGVSNAVFRLKKKLFEADYGPLDIVKSPAELPAVGR